MKFPLYGFPVFTYPGSSGGSNPGPSVPDDGWYRQTAITNPRVITNWLAAPLLHDNSQGDVSTGYTHDPPSNFLRSVAWLAVKASGMTFNQVVASIGYANTPNWDKMYGSNAWSADPSDWTEITWNSTSALAPRIDTFAWTSNAISNSSFGNKGPYKYVVGTMQDFGGFQNQPGISDIRLINSGGGEVGPTMGDVSESE